MRYIPKQDNSEACALLDMARENMRKAGVSELYNDFREKEKLNDILRNEQKMICCYCQRRIEHYQGDNKKGSHNEHLEPENGEHARIDLQLEYKNIYACCNASKGFEKRLQHCGEHKGCDVINRNFLQMRDCSFYFKYNTNGEILPQCPMDSYEEILEYRDRLTEVQQDALQMIEVLNLNVDSLKDFRKKVQEDIFKYALDKRRGQLEYKIQELNTEKTKYIQLVDMVIFFLKRFAEKQKKEQG